MSTIEATGGCHCGAVRFRFALPSRTIKVLDCNCSMCSRTGYLHLIVPHAAFELISGGNDLHSYRFGTGAAEHLFCVHCGVKSFYQPRSHPDCWSVNLRCLQDGNGFEVTVEPFDGRNWEEAKASLDT